MTAVIDSDTIELRSKKDNIITLERSKTSKEIVLIKDTAIDTVVLKSELSSAYILNFATLCYGYLIDIGTPKKWKYPHTVSLTDKWIKKNSITNVYRYGRYTHKGAVNLRISFPYVNLFYSAYETNHESRSNGGFLGFSIGVDYFYNDKTYLNLSASGIMDFFLPVPVSSHPDNGTAHYMASAYGSISNNHMLAKNRLSIGYGVSFGHDVWVTRYYSSDIHEEIPKDVFRNSNSLGLVSSIYYYTKRSFYMGIVYRPMFIQFADKTRFKYQHTMSLDFGWLIRL